jgi:hypothetical protein
MRPNLALLLGNHSYSAAFSKSPRYRGVSPPNVSAGSDNTRKKLDPTIFVAEGRKAWSVALNAGGQAFFYATARQPFSVAGASRQRSGAAFVGQAPYAQQARPDVQAFSPIMARSITK